MEGKAPTHCSNRFRRLVILEESYLSSQEEPGRLQPFLGCCFSLCSAAVAFSAGRPRSRPGRLLRRALEGRKCRRRSLTTQHRAMEGRGRAAPPQAEAGAHPQAPTKRRLGCAAGDGLRKTPRWLPAPLRAVKPRSAGGKTTECGQFRLRSDRPAPAAERGPLGGAGSTEASGSATFPPSAAASLRGGDAARQQRPLPPRSSWAPPAPSQLRPHLAGGAAPGLPCGAPAAPRLSAAPWGPRQGMQRPPCRAGLPPARRAGSTPCQRSSVRMVCRPVGAPETKESSSGRDRAPVRPRPQGVSVPGECRKGAAE